MKQILDRTDAMIIDLLQQDGRMSAVEIASQLEETSPRMVRYRIERLVREGVIFITAVVYPKALGYTVMADVLIEAEPGRILDIVSYFAGLDRVTYASAATGDRDISIQVVARSVDELYQFVLREVQEIPGVRRTRTYLLPLALKFGYNWSVPREICCEAGDEEQKEE
jgi:Lrp/AsnC family transcriptional regulator for asnA, asnC and gidA